ncbi:Translationally-Controlled Tumor Protein [Manis pentadactyla]|nr:Translationally-Controlled Tumor Protein [Manis pentadactyla]
MTSKVQNGSKQQVNDKTNFSCGSILNILKVERAAIMMIYQDFISHDEMFSHIYKIQEIAGGLFLDIEGKMVSRTEGNQLHKRSHKKYIKVYMKSIKGNLEEQRPERAKPFMAGAAEQIRHILANFKNNHFFISENMNPDGMVALLDYCKGGVTPIYDFL